MLNYSKIVVWFNRNSKEYYYKKYKVFCDYKIGYLNGYNHEVILVIDLSDLFYKMPLKRRLIKRLIRFLENIK